MGAVFNSMYKDVYVFVVFIISCRFDVFMHLLLLIDFCCFALFSFVVMLVCVLFIGFIVWVWCRVT